jgi:hypothetical protein
MRAKLRLILCLLILFDTSAAFAQRAAREQIKLRGKGRSLVLTSKGISRTFDVREEVHAARLDEVKILLISRKDSFTYLLVDACGPSRAVPNAQRCGAAEECGLLWIKLDASLKLSDIKSARYESCWQSSTSTDGYKINGRRLNMEYDDFTERKHYKLSYDAEQPEMGFVTEESVLEDRAAK